MKSTIAASIVVLLSSIGVGTVVGSIFFELGSESLKGVTSPADNPNNTITEQKLDLKQREKFQLIEEKRILVQVYDHVYKYREAKKQEQKYNQKNK